MIQTMLKPLTEDDYLAMEHTATVRHEFSCTVGGAPWRAAMPTTAGWR